LVGSVGWTQRNGACFAVAIGERIYVYGGDIVNGSDCTCEYFDFETNQWTVLPTLSSTPESFVLINRTIIGIMETVMVA